MRFFHVLGDQFTELPGAPEALPPQGSLWLASARREFEVGIAEVQAALQRWTGGQLYDMHVADLLNNQLPSHFDYTSIYDLLVFNRLAAGAGSERLFADEERGTPATARQALAAIAFRITQLVELQKDVFARFLWDTGASVDHVDADRIALPPHADEDLSILRVPQRV